MRAFAAIAAREIAQRWVLIAIAAVLGWVPVAAVYVENSNMLPVALTPMVLYVIARAFWIVAFAIGMSLLGRQLYGGQLAFYFARPVSGWTIAAGKIVGAAVAVLAAELLVVTPIALFPDQLDGRWAYDVAHARLENLVVAQLFLGGGLVAGVLVRSRSSWFAVDTFGLVTVVLLAVRVIDRITAVGERYVVFYDGRWQRPWELPTAQLLPVAEQQRLLFAERRFLDNVQTLWGGLAIAAAVALLAAAAAAVVFGRTDGERAHRALSTTLWSSLCAVCAAGLAIAHWGLQ